MENNIGYFEKSHFLNNFRETFLVEKTGKEVKEKVTIVLQKENSEIEKYKLELDSLKSQIKEEPTNKFDNYYLIDGFEDKIGEIPLIYQLQSTCPEVNDPVEFVGEKDPTEITALKHKYDNLVHKLVECMIERSMMQTILTSYPDKKLFKLTLKEASLLGF